LLQNSGIPSLNIPSIEPLEVDNVVLKHGSGNNRFNLKQSFVNVKIFGLSSSILNRTRLNLDDDFKLKSEIYTDRLDFTADYDMEGQIMFFPVSGHGKMNCSMQQLVTRHELLGSKFMKADGKTYIRITDYKINFKPKKVSYKFDNLFHGDKVLGQNTNKFMNDNWKIVFNGLIPEYESFFGEKFKKIANDVFENVPLNQIFLD
jgi:hypothetical protein